MYYLCIYVRVLSSRPLIPVTSWRIHRDLVIARREHTSTQIGNVLTFLGGRRGLITGQPPQLHFIKQNLYRESNSLTVRFQVRVEGSEFWQNFELGAFECHLANRHQPVSLRS